MKLAANFAQWTRMGSCGKEKLEIEEHNHVFAAHAQYFWFLDGLSRIQRCEN